MLENMFLTSAPPPLEGGNFAKPCLSGGSESQNLSIQKFMTQSSIELQRHVESVSERVDTLFYRYR